MKNFLFELKEGLLISLRAIKANKIRAALTTLGIVIGVCSVVVMSTAIKGIDNAFEDGISSLGSDNLYIDKWAWFSNDDWWKLRNRKNITMDEYRLFAQMVKTPFAVAPTILTMHTIKYNEKTTERTLISGTTEKYLETTNFTFDEGRFFTEIESDGSRDVAVLGFEVANYLFPNGGAVDKFVKIKGIKYKVVGVLAKQGSVLLGNFNPDNQVFMPLGSVFKHFANANFRSIMIVVKAQSNAMVEETKAEAREVMRKVRKLRYDQEDDFSINQQEGLTQSYESTVGVIQIAGFFITGLSLFVGAIGIMNIMFVSVKERTKEIGIRKAIGAKRITILGQFLIESSIICLLGGLIGLLVAVFLSIVINQFLPTSVQIDAVIIAIVISLATGVISGFAPAYSASKMDPVEALRYE